MSLLSRLALLNDVNLSTHTWTGTIATTGILIFDISCAKYFQWLKLLATIKKTGAANDVNLSTHTWTRTIATSVWILIFVISCASYFLFWEISLRLLHGYVIMIVNFTVNAIIGMVRNIQKYLSFNLPCLFVIRPKTAKYNVLYSVVCLVCFLFVT